jgi:ergothioneine biosynthesis protein EgtB
MSDENLPGGTTTIEAPPIAARYFRVREATVELCRTLETEDLVIQSMPGTSPIKWHLAHTAWFFETFVLARASISRRPFHPLYGALFNSYYLQAGSQFPRAQRGLISRPTVDEVHRYREHVDQEVLALLRDGVSQELEALVELGVHHEEQHQELILTDLKHLFSLNPLCPVYRERRPEEDILPGPLFWVAFPGGIRSIGHSEGGFAFDNELPRHQAYLEPFEIASRPVSCGEYRAFLDDGGYHSGKLWLSDGWAEAQREGWEAPLYWKKEDGRWRIMTLTGMRDVNDREPLCHVSYYEAEAFARWAGARLPTEAEWEVAAAAADLEGNFLESGRFHPVPAASTVGVGQLFGDVWEWTSSAYLPYPGYQPPLGALGEYNGKFMCNQFVLRGGSCVTPRAHIRRTYRNFFYPRDRWQFSGIRLARKV